MADELPVQARSKRPRPAASTGDRYATPEKRLVLQLVRPPLGVGPSEGPMEELLEVPGEGMRPDDAGLEAEAVHGVARRRTWKPRPALKTPGIRPVVRDEVPPGDVLGGIHALGDGDARRTCGRPGSWTRPSFRLERIEPARDATAAAVAKRRGQPDELDAVRVAAVGKGENIVLDEEREHALRLPIPRPGEGRD